MQTFKYCDVLHRLEGFDPWLISLGLTPRSNDRIHQAFNTLRMAEAATVKDGKPENIPRFKESIYSH